MLRTLSTAVQAYAMFFFVSVPVHHRTRRVRPRSVFDGLRNFEAEARMITFVSILVFILVDKCYTLCILVIYYFVYSFVN